MTDYHSLTDAIKGHRDDVRICLITALWMQASITTAIVTILVWLITG